MTNTPPSSANGPASTNDDVLVQMLPSAERLALVYAPQSARLPTLALFALDARVAGLLRNSREPMLAQLRLSWWRETLRQDAEKWPQGDPILSALRTWNGAHTELVALIDGWESLTGPAPLGPEALDGMARGRGDAFAALARVLGRLKDVEAARSLAREWALADLGMRLSNPAEREAARTLLMNTPRTQARLPRPLRPLLVLHGLARRRLAREEHGAAISPTAMLKALRLGLLGR
ncbi:hypothetical protein WSK_1115 [Novosphingobium sp. Rr 2-17]|uniref:hypothetical protein n=1 Tax=Novosphingobium sp. Rr 2-17 TaxID=555793 RepID=UPI000269A1AF|nr:hypothetical protein [Novosphingobium sp. Rr 2-17]EIZ80322.1 hypothetical protein WSK_1115 [Novosphingobium sp. Rr 2-17]